MVEVAFEDLQNADLQIDCVYKGGTAPNLGSDPLSHLFPCGNAGGFRKVLNCKMKLELRNWDKGACPFIPIRAAAGPYFQFLYKKSP